jgi:hypothetical protein
VYQKITNEEIEKNLEKRIEKLSEFKFDLYGKMKEYSVTNKKNFGIRDAQFQDKYTYMTSTMVVSLLYCLKYDYSTVIPLIAISSYWYKINTIIDLDKQYEKYVSKIKDLVYMETYSVCFDKSTYRKRMIDNLNVLKSNSIQITENLKAQNSLYQLTDYTQIYFEGHTFSNCMEATMLNMMYLIYKIVKKLPNNEDLANTLKNSDVEGIHKVLQEWTKKLTYLARTLKNIQFANPENYELRATYDNFIIIMNKLYDLNEESVEEIIQIIFGENVQSVANINNFYLNGINYDLYLTKNGGHSYLSIKDGGNLMKMLFDLFGTGIVMSNISHIVMSYTDEGSLMRILYDVQLNSDIVKRSNVGVLAIEYILLSDHYRNYLLGLLTESEKIKYANAIEPYKYKYALFGRDFDACIKKNSEKYGKYVFIENNRKILKFEHFRELLLHENYIVKIIVDCKDIFVPKIEQNSHMKNLTIIINENTTFEYDEFQFKVSEFGILLHQDNMSLDMLTRIEKFVKTENLLELELKYTTVNHEHILFHDTKMGEKYLFEYPIQYMKFDKPIVLDTNVICTKYEEMENVKVINGIIKLNEKYIKMTTFEKCDVCAYIGKIITVEDILKLEKLWKIKSGTEFIVMCKRFIAKQEAFDKLSGNYIIITFDDDDEKLMNLQESNLLFTNFYTVHEILSEFPETTNQYKVIWRRASMYSMF